MSEVLVNYIATNLARGVPRQEIEKALITSGWDIYSINQAFAKEVRKSVDNLSQTIPITPPKRSIVALFITLLLYIVVSFLIMTAYLFLDKDLYSNVITIPELPELCAENIKGCNYPFAFLSVIQTIVYLLAPGILIVYAFRKKYGLAIVMLLIVSILRLLFVFHFFRFFTTDVFYIPLYQRYLSSILMLIVVIATYLFFRFIKIPESVKTFVLGFEIAIVAALLIIIPKLTPISQKIDIILQILNSKPLITSQLTENIKTKRAYIEQTSKELRKAQEDISPLAACTADQERILFPNSLILNGKVYPKRLFVIVDGKKYPLSEKSEVIGFGDDGDLMELSITRSSNNSQNFSVLKTVSEATNYGERRLFGEDVFFQVDKNNKQWDIQAFVPSQINIEIRSFWPADPKIQVSDLKGSVYDWFSKICYSYL